MLALSVPFETKVKHIEYDIDFAWAARERSEAKTVPQSPPPSGLAYVAVDVFENNSFAMTPDLDADPRKDQKDLPQV